MSMRVLIVGLVAAVLFPLAAEAAKPAAPARAEQLTALFNEFKASAKKRLTPGSFDVSVEGKAKLLVYDEQSVVDLKTVLKKMKRNDPTSIYAARVLLQPLLRAKPEVMLAGISEADSARRKAGKYKNFKQINEADIEKHKFPEFDPDESAIERLKKMNKVQKLRDTKLKKDMPIQMHNLEVYRILQTRILLAMAVKDPGEDKKLFRLFSELENKGLHDCFSVIGNIQHRVKGMKPERARAFRDRCIKLGNQLKVERREYLVPTRMVVRGNANSVIGKQTDYPGLKLLTCANEINKVLKEPEIKVPTAAKINEYIAEREKARKQSEGRGNRGGRK